MDRHTVKRISVAGLLLAAVATVVWAAQPTFNLYSPSPGIQKNTGATYANTSAASTDVVGLWSGSCSSTTYLRGDGSCQTPPGTGGGTVDSVAMTVPSGFSVSGSPITTTGTLAVSFTTGQTANRFLATPDGTTGALSLRAVVAGDLPLIDLASSSAGGVTGILPGANGGTANGFMAFSGPATSLKTFALPNASATILTTNAAVTVAQGGTGVATLTGIAKGSGTSAFSAAAAADVIGLWSGTCNSGTFLRADGACESVAGSGTVTSVAATVPSVFSITGSPVTTTGTLAIDWATGQTQNRVLASPNGSSGAVALRALVGADLPVVNLASSSAGGVTGNLPVANLNSGTSATANTLWHGNATWGAVSLSADVTGTLADGSLSSNVPLKNAANTFTAAQTVDTTGSVVAFTTDKLAIGVDTPFVTGGNISSGANALAIGTTGATAVSLFTNNIARGTISSTGAWSVATPTSGTALTINAVTGTAGATVTDGTTSMSMTLNGVGILTSTNDLYFQANGAIKGIASTGWQFGSPTGGDKGAGTLNTAAGIYQNNVSVCLNDGTNCGVLNASNLSSGTVPDARLSGTYSGALTFSGATAITAGTGTFTSATVGGSAVCRADGTNCPSAGSVKYASGYNANGGAACTMGTVQNITSCTYNSTGDYTITLNSSWAYTTPEPAPCVLSAGNGAGATYGTVFKASATTLNVTTYDAATGAAANTRFQILCTGT